MRNLGFELGGPSPALRLILVFGFTVLFESPVRDARGCIWDADTSRLEVEELPRIGQVIAGRFERNPPLYFEMRLERRAREIEIDPGLYDAYDDCAVACDRLARGDEALEWMNRKRARLEADGDFDDPSKPGTSETYREHVYRYFANIGTLRIHDWLRTGGATERLADARRARDEIARAIEINPNAHFGREKYQLAAMEWLIESRESADEAPSRANPTALDSFIWRANAQGSDAREALIGLIVLGNAWESVDVFYAFAQVLVSEGRTADAALAFGRIAELIRGGGRSLVPGAPEGEELVELVRRSLEISPNNRTLHDYERVRAQAERWQKRRTKYALAKLKSGAHPDTDPGFWQGFHDKSLLERTLETTEAHPLASVLAAVAATGLLMAVLQRGYSSLRSRRKVPAKR